VEEDIDESIIGIFSGKIFNDDVVVGITTISRIMTTLLLCLLFII